MVHATLRDLLFRRRRYLISILGCGLVFAMSLVMTGLADAFPLEWRRTVKAIGARSFITPSQLSGPFTGVSPFEAERLPEGVEPLAFAVQTATAEEPVSVAVFGLDRGSPSIPAAVEGRAPRKAGEVLVSDRSTYEIGDHFGIAGHRLRVVGLMDSLSVNGGMPVVVLSLEEAQKILYRGLPAVSSGIVRSSDPPSVGDGLQVQAADAAIEDAVRLLASARKSINFMKVLLWLVAALIVGSVTFLSVIERLRDFAVFKTIGTPVRSIAGSVMLQSVVVALFSSLLGIALGQLIAPVFPLPVAVSGLAMVLLPALGIGVGLVASLLGLSRVLRVEPALAFGGAA